MPCEINDNDDLLNLRLEDNNSAPVSVLWDLYLIQFMMTFFTLFFGFNFSESV